MLIHDLLARARDRTGANSERALARMIGVGPVSLRRYRAGHGLPSKIQMLKISQAAGITPEAGLVLLNMWRSDGEARTIYRSMWQKLVSNADQTYQ
jgi:hypothetical protein